MNGVIKKSLQLLMSTSVPQYLDSGLPYSPRQQGSGIADCWNALETEAYLYNEAEEYSKAKISLFDDPERTGNFQATFHIKNISKDQQTYQMKPIALSQNVVKDDLGTLVFDGTEREVTSQVQIRLLRDGKLIKGNQVTVAAGEDVAIDVEFQMDKELMKYYDDNMVNSGFLEGYILFDNISGGYALSLPYLGFYGDWCQAPIFEQGWSCQNELYQSVGNKIFTKLGDSIGILGLNPFDVVTTALTGLEMNKQLDPELFTGLPDLKTDIDKMALSPNGDGYYDDTSSFFMGILRNGVNRKIYITREEAFCTVVLTGPKVNEVRKLNAGSGDQDSNNISIVKVWKNASLAPEIVNNMKFKITYYADVCYNRHESEYKHQELATFPITIDLEKPEVKAVSVTKKDDKTYLNLNVSDNQYVAYVEASLNDAESENAEKLDDALFDEPEAGMTSQISLDITKAIESGKDVSDITLKVYDYAYNGAEFQVGSLLESGLPEAPWAPRTAPSTEINHQETEE